MPCAQSPANPRTHLHQQLRPKGQVRECVHDVRRVVVRTRHEAQAQKRAWGQGWRGGRKAYEVCRSTWLMKRRNNEGVRANYARLLCVVLRSGVGSNEQGARGKRCGEGEGD